MKHWNELITHVRANRKTYRFERVRAEIKSFPHSRLYESTHSSESYSSKFLLCLSFARIRPMNARDMMFYDSYFTIEKYQRKTTQTITENYCQCEKRLKYALQKTFRRQRRRLSCRLKYHLSNASICSSIKIVYTEHNSKSLVNEIFTKYFVGEPQNRHVIFCTKWFLWNDYMLWGKKYIQIMLQWSIKQRRDPNEETWLNER